MKWIEMVEQDFIREKKSAFREFEDQKVYLKDQLIAELEEKQKLIETERHNMETIHGIVKASKFRKINFAQSIAAE